VAAANMMAPFQKLLPVFSFFRAMLVNGSCSPPLLPPSTTPPTP
jgi:hypothetical protein